MYPFEGLFELVERVVELDGAALELLDRLARRDELVVVVVDERLLLAVEFAYRLDQFELFVDELLERRIGQQLLNTGPRVERRVVWSYHTVCTQHEHVHSETSDRGRTHGERVARLLLLLLGVRRREAVELPQLPRPSRPVWRTIAPTRSTLRAHCPSHQRRGHLALSNRMSRVLEYSSTDESSHVPTFFSAETLAQLCLRTD